MIEHIETGTLMDVMFERVDICWTDMAEASRLLKFLGFGEDVSLKVGLAQAAYLLREMCPNLYDVEAVETMSYMTVRALRQHMHGTVRLYRPTGNGSEA
jgi:hypothetical protein